jgi:uncharacterized protein YcbK (DUF882 family)
MSEQISFDQLVQNELDRRGFLKSGLTLSAAALLSVSLVSPAKAYNSGMSYRVAFRNQHTGETYSGVYRVGNKYLPEAFQRINYVLRDFRQNEIFPIDPRVIDIVSTVHRATGSYEPYELLSGYRSPKTNAMLRGNSRGVARHSYHMSGQAVDVRLNNVNSQHVRKMAISLHAGGVGYYPRSDFVHMDSGNFRTW